MDGAGAVVVAANWYAFRSGEQIRHARVMSVCVLWVVAGTGTVTSRGTTSRLTPGSVLVLPWGHDVEYQADRRAPFRLGTVHVVPEHDRSAPVRPVVAHQPDDPMLDAPDRRDRPTTAGVDVRLPLLLASTTDTARRITALGRYVVERFTAGTFDEPVFGALGELLLAERTTVAHDVDGATERLPAVLERMTGYVEERLDRPLPVSEIAAVGGCSPSTAERLFHRHHGASVSAWVRGVRMREAATLLRTSGLRVGEVARAVGFADPLYFSRVFRVAHGVPPSRYAADRIRP